MPHPHQFYIADRVTDAVAVRSAAEKATANGSVSIVHHHSYSVRCDVEEFGCETLSPIQPNELTTAPD